MRLDHLILLVNDLNASVDFYTRVLGLAHEGERPPFATVRVTPDFVIQLAPWGTKGGEHLAFALTREEFDQVFRRVREPGIEYGDAFDAVGNMRGPGRADGAHGATCSLYFFDPNRHLIEIAYYESPKPTRRKVMNISMHDMSVGSFVPMLQSLSEVLDKGAEYATSARLDLVNARLAPDMFTLAQQVQ